MNTKALYGVMLALLLPLTAYFIVKKYGDNAVIVLKHHFPDSVINVTKNGKAAKG